MSSQRFNSGRDGRTLVQLELIDEAWSRLRRVAERDHEVHSALELMATAEKPLAFLICVDVRDASNVYTGADLIPLEVSDDVNIQRERLEHETGAQHKLVFVARDGDVYRRVT